MPVFADRRDRLLPCSLRPCGWCEDRCTCFPLFPEIDTLNWPVTRSVNLPKPWDMHPLCVGFVRTGLVTVRVSVRNKYSGVLVDSRTFPNLNPFTGYVRKWEEDVMSFLKSVAERVPVKDPDLHASPAGIEKQCPALAEYMTSGRLPDGSGRQGSSLTFFCEQGKWKCVLKERGANLDLWAQGDTFHDALKALDTRLRDEVVEWRPSGPVKRR